MHMAAFLGACVAVGKMGSQHAFGLMQLRLTIFFAACMANDGKWGPQLASGPLRLHMDAFSVAMWPTTEYGGSASLGRSFGGAGT